jgi:hypothetical protein
MLYSPGVNLPLYRLAALPIGTANPNRSPPPLSPPEPKETQGDAPEPKETHQRPRDLARSAPSPSRTCSPASSAPTLTTPSRHHPGIDLARYAPPATRSAVPLWESRRARWTQAILEHLLPCSVIASPLLTCDALCRASDVYQFTTNISLY